jgi:hypothetical protein
MLEFLARLGDGARKLVVEGARFAHEGVAA